MVLRVLGFFLGGLVAVVAALAFLVWVSFDAERTAGALTQHFKDHYQRTLVLGKEPQLRVWPRPALVLRQASLSEPGRSDVFASVASVRLDLAPLALLARRHEILRVSLSGLQAHCVRARNGEWNLANLLAVSTASVAPPPWLLQISEISLRGATLQVDDAGTGMQVEIRNLDADAQSVNKGVPGQLSWQGQWLDKAGAGDLEFKGQARYTLLKGLNAGTLDELSVRISGDGYGLQGAEARFTSERLGWGSQATQGYLSKANFKLQGAAGAQAVSFSAAAPAFGWQSFRLQGEKLAASLTLRTVDAQTDFQLALPHLQESGQGFSTDGLDFAWQYKAGSEHGSQGKLNARLNADVQGNAYRLRDIKAEASLQHPRLHTPTARISVTGQAQWRANGGSELTLDGALGEDKLRLQAQLPQLWPLSGRFELSASRLDLDRLVAEARPGTRLPPLQMPGFEQLSLSGKLKLGNLRVAGLNLNSLQSPLSVDKGVLTASGFMASLYGGQIGGDLSAEGSSGRLDVQGDFNDLALELLALEGGLPIPLSGRLAGTYKLATLLKADKQPLAELNGAVRWTLTNSAIRGVDLVRSLREFRPAIAQGKQSARSPVDAETTEIGVVSSRFLLAGGKLQADSIQSRNSWLALNGAGSADLLRDELDFSLQASLLPGVTAMAARDLADLRSKPLPLRLKGPLLRPDVRYEPGAAPLKPLTPAKKNKP